MLQNEIFGKQLNRMKPISIGFISDFQKYNGMERSGMEWS